jgi:sn-glycerol 3-phosphate transport system substrate-binding protein
MVILASSPQEKQDAAFRFVSFASSPEITSFWAQSTGYMPVRKSALNSSEMQAFYKERPAFKTAVDQLALTRPQDACAVLLPNGELITAKGMERIVINEEDVKPVLDDVAAELASESAPLVEAINERNQ